MSLCTELSHINVVSTEQIILEEKCIYIVFEYAEHDLLQIIHFHTQHQSRPPIPAKSIKSIMYQLLSGLLYLHRNWVLHRDLKPANIMVTREGKVKIGDLGLARIFLKPLMTLYSGDKVVVTIWYRAPELLLGSRHYTTAIDIWAVGCIFAELLSLKPIFKGEEAKMDSKKTVPFQKNQMQKIAEIMGMPSREKWPLLDKMPEYNQLMSASFPSGNSRLTQNRPQGLDNWYRTTLKEKRYGSGPEESPGDEGLNLLHRLLEYDPEKRITAVEALQHPYFTSGEKPAEDCFEGSTIQYPHRRVSPDDTDIRTGSLPGTKRSAALHDDAIIGRPAKRIKEG